MTRNLHTPMSLSTAKPGAVAPRKRGINLRTFVASSGVVWLAAVSAAHAQAAVNNQANVAAIEEIVVSATRIKAAGFTAPTPTTVIGAEAIQQAAQPNLFAAVAELPSLQGSTGTTVNTGVTSAGNNGLSSLNLRGLGPIRTLTLLDGQRVVPAYVQGLADVSLFPQLLVQRVDVVTGGASASWGSDAISGVVNFVTDKRFEGFKANIQGGTSTYSDDRQGLLQVAAGHSFLEDKLHAQISGEYYSNGGAPAPLIGGEFSNSRPTAYRSNTTSYAQTATPAGQAQYYYYPYNAQIITQGRNCLITAGPSWGHVQVGRSSTSEWARVPRPAANLGGDPARAAAAASSA